MTTTDPTSETGSPDVDDPTPATSCPRPDPRTTGRITFVFYNHDGGADVEAALPAIALALSESVGDGSPFALAWGNKGVVFRIGHMPPDSDRRAHEIAIHLRSDLPEAPGAAAFHTTTGGVPDIEIGISNFAGLTMGPEPMSLGIDHEVKETLGDLGANQEATLTDGRTAKAFEMADEVQNTSYQASNGVTLSNFLLPSAFIPGAPAPWDFLGVKTSQEDYSHGYAILFTVLPPEAPAGFIPGARHARPKNGRVAYLLGTTLTAAQKKRKSSPYSRTYRRGLRLGRS